MMHGQKNIKKITVYYQNNKLCYKVNIPFIRCNIPIHFPVSSTHSVLLGPASILYDG